MYKLMRQCYICGISTLGILIATPAPGAGTLFDGSYHGVTKVTFGNAPVCGSDHEVSVTVEDGEIRHAFGEFSLMATVAQDGTFSGRARKGNHGGGQALHAKGRISGGDLEADFNVSGVHGRVCSYHWSLRKA